MTLERSFRPSILSFTCNFCGDTEDSDEDEGFMEMWDSLKDEGWRARKIDEEWHHACPKCKFPPD